MSAVVTPEHTQPPPSARRWCSRLTVRTNVSVLPGPAKAVFLSSLRIHLRPSAARPSAIHRSIRRPSWHATIRCFVCDFRLVACQRRPVGGMRTPRMRYAGVNPAAIFESRISITTHHSQSKSLPATGLPLGRRVDRQRHWVATPSAEVGSHFVKTVVLLVEHTPCVGQLVHDLVSRDPSDGRACRY